MQFYCHIFGIDLNIELLNSNKQGSPEIAVKVVQFDT